MQLNARDFSDGLPLQEWLEKSIFPTEMKLTKEYAKIGALASALEMIKTGSTFACDMYHFPDAIVSALNEAGLRGVVCGPQTQWPPREGGDDGAVRRELDSQLASNKPENKVHYGVATHAVYTCDEDTLLAGKELARNTTHTLQFTFLRLVKKLQIASSKLECIPVEYLDSIDYFIPNKTICAHGSWVKKSEMRTMAARKGDSGSLSIVQHEISMWRYCFSSSISRSRCGSASRDRRPCFSGSGSDMAHEARMACLVQRHDHWDASALAKEAFAMATTGSQDWQYGT